MFNLISNPIQEKIKVIYVDVICWSRSLEVICNEVRACVYRPNI